MRKAATYFFFFFFSTVSILANSPAEPSEEGLKITDSLSRDVSIPARVERILSLQPEITRIIVALGGGEKLVGLDYFLRREDHLFKIIFPDESLLPVVLKPDDSVNRELVVRLEPDVIFASPSEFQFVGSLEQVINIPILALSSMGRFDKLTEMMILVGRVIGREKRAEELATLFKETVSRIRGLTGSYPLEKRPRVYLSFWGLLTRTPVKYEPVNAAGGINLAEGLLPSYAGSLGTVINLEKLLEWNPEIILVHGNYPPDERRVRVEEILQDSRLSSLQAIRDGKVYYTFGFWYWWDPALVLVETLYLAKRFYPEAFINLNIEREGNEIFLKFYGRENIFSELCRILDCHEWTKS